MTASRESFIVVGFAVLSLCLVVLGVALLPPPTTEVSLASPLCARNATAYPGSVVLTPQSPVLLPKFDRYNVSAGGAEGIGFQLDAPADFSGAWASTFPTYVFVMNVSSGECEVTFIPPPASPSGTINLTLFPGNYVVLFGWSPGADILLTVTQPWMVTFDRGLDVLQGPEQIALPANGHVAWTITAPSNVSRFFFEEAIATNSCNFELAVLSPAVYRAFVAGQGPLNGNGTDVLDRVVESTPGSTSSCGPSSGTIDSWCEAGPFNWTSGDVAVFYNGADYAATLYPFAPLEVSYLTG